MSKHSFKAQFYHPDTGYLIVAILLFWACVLGPTFGHDVPGDPWKVVQHYDDYHVEGTPCHYHVYENGEVWDWDVTDETRLSENVNPPWLDSHLQDGHPHTDHDGKGVSHPHNDVPHTHDNYGRHTHTGYTHTHEGESRSPQTDVERHLREQATYHNHEDHTDAYEHTHRGHSHNGLGWHEHSPVTHGPHNDPEPVSDPEPVQVSPGYPPTPQPVETLDVEVAVSTPEPVVEPEPESIIPVVEPEPIIVVPKSDIVLTQVMFLDWSGRGGLPQWFELHNRGGDGNLKGWTLTFFPRGGGKIIIVLKDCPLASGETMIVTGKRVGHFKGHLWGTSEGVEKVYIDEAIPNLKNRWVLTDPDGKEIYRRDVPWNWGWGSHTKDRYRRAVDVIPSEPYTGDDPIYYGHPRDAGNPPGYHVDVAPKAPSHQRKRITLWGALKQ